MDPNNLFDYIGAVFERNSNWDRAIKNTHKAKHHFMLHRFLGIQHPVQSNEMNRMGVNSISAADYWHHMLGKLYNQVPKWMYTKTKKAEKVDKKEYVPSDAAKNLWMDMHNCGPRDFKQMMEFYPEEFKEQLKDLEGIVKHM